MDVLQQLKPGIPRRLLYFLAALLWGAAGIVLDARGVSIIIDGDASGLWFGATLGVAGGWLFYKLLFIRISGKHIKRIGSIPYAKPCAFSFLDWRGYFIMALMITLGVTLRTTGIIPPSVLGPLYIIMGTALLLAAVRFVSAGFRFTV